MRDMKSEHTPLQSLDESDVPEDKWPRSHLTNENTAETCVSLTPAFPAIRLAAGEVRNITSVTNHDS